MGVKGTVYGAARSISTERTVTGHHAGSPPPRRVVECGGECALVAYISLGLELLGRVARVMLAYLWPILPIDHVGEAATRSPPRDASSWHASSSRRG